MADITYTSLKSDVLDVLMRDVDTRFRKGFVLADGVVMPAYYEEHGQRILDMEVRDDDVWVCSYPKTGTTWTQEMVWCIAKDLDFKAAQEILTKRFPYLEYTTLFDVQKMSLEIPDVNLPLNVTDSIKYINQMESPRFIKTHLPYELLPKKLKDRSTKAKIVYVARNAKDTCLSYFYHYCLFVGYKGNFEDFCKLFTSDSLLYSPFFEHILSFWNQKDDPRVLFLKYEDMKQDLRSIIRQTAKFLGKDLLDDQLLDLEDHLSFESMKKNRSVNFEPIIEFYKALNLSDVNGTFMRSGTVGGGKQKMSPEYLKIFDEWEEKCLEKTGLKL